MWKYHIWVEHVGKKNKIVKNTNIQIRPWSSMLFTYVIGQVKHSFQEHADWHRTNDNTLLTQFWCLVVKRCQTMLWVQYSIKHNHLNEAGQSTCSCVLLEWVVSFWTLMASAQCSIVVSVFRLFLNGFWKMLSLIPACQNGK